MPHKPQPSAQNVKTFPAAKMEIIFAKSWRGSELRAGGGRLSAVASCLTGIGTLDLIGLSNHNESQGGNLSFSDHQRARIMADN